MRFIKEVRFDLKNGIIRNELLLSVPILIGTITFFDFWNQIHYWEGVVTYGDYWFYLYGGMKEYIPAPGNTFQFPIVWIVVLLTSSFLVLNYPYRDMHGIGQQILVQTGGRTCWWVSKCLWNVICTVLFHGLILLTGVVLCLLFKIPVTMEIHMDLLKVLFQLYEEVGFRRREVIPALIFIMPVLLSVGMNLIQMTFSLFCDRVFGFLFSGICLVASAYLARGYMMGNYAMALRYKWIWNDGVLIENGIFIIIGLIGVSVLIGIIRFRHYDILKRG